MNLSFLLMLVLTAEPGETGPLAFAERREGLCVIRNFNDRPFDGYNYGFKVWFGERLTMKCSFHVIDFVGNNSLSAGGNIVPTQTPMHCSFNSAFFDADDRLVACASGPDPHDASAVKGDEESQLPLQAFIPLRVEERITGYKVAFYESTAPIRESIVDDNRTLYVTKARTGSVSQSSSIPLWKSDGELRNTPFTIRKETRLLKSSGNDRWQAAMGEYECQLKKIPDLPLNDGHMDSALRINLRSELKLKIDCRCKVNEDNSVVVNIYTENDTDKKLFSKLYLCFLDKHGNLVSSVEATANADAKSHNPSVTVNGKPLTTYLEFKSASMPLGIESKITSYKFALYESETPIGKIASDRSQ